MLTNEQRLIIRGNKMKIKLSFEDWYNENENWLSINASETGADRELDFDFEKWADAHYEHYLIHLSN